MVRREGGRVCASSGVCSSGSLGDLSGPARPSVCRPYDVGAGRCERLLSQQTSRSYKLSVMSVCVCASHASPVMLVLQTGKST